MSQLEQAKSVILHECRAATTTHVIIPVELDGDNLAYFQQALESTEVQRELEREGLIVELRILDLIGRVEQHMLAVIDGIGSGVQSVIFPCYSKDADVYYKALARPLVQAELTQRGITAQVQLVDRAGPDIVIAPLEAF